ncbi:MAG: hypothetical protein IT436_02650 [Phycisphaerales bacterium]|nr:hypothetical protein [Phycisphaerales bacterium]
MTGPLITPQVSSGAGLDLLFTLAQTPNSRGKVSPLPSPPVFTRYLFENPWPGVIVLVLAAVVMFIVLNQRGRLTQGAAIAATLVAAAAGLWFTARSVVTPREQLRRQTYTLIGAVLRGDEPRMRQILEPEAIAYFPEAESGVRILDWVGPNLSEAYRIREWAVLDEQASMDGPGTARTQFHVRVTAEDSGLPYLGWVRFNWRQDADGWKVKSVEEIARGLPGQ